MKKNRIINATIFLELKDIKYQEYFIELSAILTQYNFIEEENRICRYSESKPNTMEIICNFVDEYTYKNWLNQDFIKNYFQDKFSNYLVTPPYTERFIEIISKIDDLNVCDCKKIENYFLKGKKYVFDGGLYCSTCKKAIPLYKFNQLDIDISNWLDIFYSIYNIYLYTYDNDYLENWAESMIFSIDSEINKWGMKLASELASSLKKKVYYLNFSKEEDILLCPYCRKRMNKLNGKYFCENCNR